MERERGGVREAGVDPLLRLNWQHRALYSWAEKEVAYDKGFLEGMLHERAYWRRRAGRGAILWFIIGGAAMAFVRWVGVRWLG